MTENTKSTRSDHITNNSFRSIMFQICLMEKMTASCKHAFKSSATLYRQLSETFHTQTHIHLRLAIGSPDYEYNRHCLDKDQSFKTLVSKSLMHIVAGFFWSFQCFFSFHSWNGSERSLSTWRDRGITRSVPSPHNSLCKWHALDQMNNKLRLWFQVLLFIWRWCIGETYWLRIHSKELTGRFHTYMLYKAI